MLASLTKEWTPGLEVILQEEEEEEDIGSDATRSGRPIARRKLSWPMLHNEQVVLVVVVVHYKQRMLQDGRTD